MTVVADPRAEPLDAAECADLLGRHHFGRIAVNTPEGPAIFPVNYLWSAGHIVIRTNPGTKLGAAVQSLVAFEIDHVEEASHTAWSVLVMGTAFEVTDSVDEVSAELQKLPVATWGAGDTTAILRIEPRSITGRSVPVGEGD